MREFSKKKCCFLTFAPIRSVHLRNKKNSFALFLKLPGNDILP